MDNHHQFRVAHPFVTGTTRIVPGREAQVAIHIPTNDGTVRLCFNNLSELNGWYNRLGQQFRPVAKAHI